MGERSYTRGNEELQVRGVWRGNFGGIAMSNKWFLMGLAAVVLVGAPFVGFSLVGAQEGGNVDGLRQPRAEELERL